MTPQAHIPPAEIPLWIELIKTLGYVAGIVIPAYFSYRIVKWKRGNNGSSN